MGVIKISVDKIQLPRIGVIKLKEKNRLPVGIKVSSIGSESKSTLLHPVITIVKNNLVIIDIVHFDEDIFANYQDESKYYFKIMRMLHMFM